MASHEPGIDHCTPHCPAPLTFPNRCFPGDPQRPATAVDRYHRPQPCPRWSLPFIVTPHPSLWRPPVGLHNLRGWWAVGGPAVATRSCCGAQRVLATVQARALVIRIQSHAIIEPARVCGGPFCSLEPLADDVGALMATSEPGNPLPVLFRVILS